MNLSHALRSLVRDERGQDLIEYGLLATFISIVAIALITNLGVSVNSLYGVIDGEVADAAN